MVTLCSTFPGVSDLFVRDDLPQSAWTRVLGMLLRLVASSNSDSDDIQKKIQWAFAQATAESQAGALVEYLTCGGSKEADPDSLAAALQLVTPEGRQFRVILDGSVCCMI